MTSQNSDNLIPKENSKKSGPKNFRFMLLKPLNRYKNIYLHFLLVAFLIAVDQFFKSCLADGSQAVDSPAKFLGFSIATTKNPHFIFGWDFGANPLLVQSLLICIFLLLLFYYSVFVIFAGKHYQALKLAFSFLFAGFTSNLWNKVSQFYVLDYIKWSWAEQFWFYFNLADVFQLLGWLLCISFLIVNYNKIWRKSEQRKSLFILKSYQYELLAYCTAGFVLISAFFILFSWQFFSLVRLDNSYDLNQLSMLFFLMLFFILIGLYFFIGLFFIYVSNKIYGPVFAFEKYIRKLLKAEKTGDFKLRSRDHFKSLQDLAKDIKKSLKSK